MLCILIFLLLLGISIRYMLCDRYIPSGCGFESHCSHVSFRFAPVLSNAFLEIQATIECEFTLNCVWDLVRIYNQMHSQQSSIIWLVWLNGWVLIYKLTGCGFESHWSHLFIHHQCTKKLKSFIIQKMLSGW